MTIRVGWEQNWTTKISLIRFHVLCSILHQRLHVKYISSRWYDITGLAVPIMIFLKEGYYLQGNYKTILPSGEVEVIPSTIFTEAITSWLKVLEFRLFTGFVLSWATQRVVNAEQGMLTLLLIFPDHTRFYRGIVCVLCLHVSTWRNKKL